MLSKSLSCNDLATAITALNAYYCCRLKGETDPGDGDTTITKTADRMVALARSMTNQLMRGNDRQ